MKYRGVREDILNFNRKGLASEGGEKVGGLTRLIIFIIFIFVCILLLTGAMTYVGTEQGKRALLEIDEFWAKNNPVNWYLGLIEEQATADIWGTKTNTSSLKKGLDLVDMISISGGTIPPGKDFQVRYDFRLWEIDDYYGVDNVQFFCELHDASDDFVTLGEVTPSYTMSFVRENDVILCEINGDDTGDLDGAHSVVGWMQFPFRTEDVTLKVYFTTDKIYNSLIEDKKDFFESFDIPESRPIQAVYNGEPLRVAIGVTPSGVGEQPVIVGGEGIGNYPTLGIHLENEWVGSVKDIYEFYVYLPKGIEIDSDLSDNPSFSCPFEKVGTLEGKNIYSMSEDTKDELFGHLLERDIAILGKVEYTENERNFLCFLDIEESFVAEDYEIDEYIVDIEYLYKVDPEEAVVDINAFDDLEDLP